MRFGCIIQKHLFLSNIIERHHFIYVCIQFYADQIALTVHSVFVGVRTSSCIQYKPFKTFIGVISASSRTYHRVILFVKGYNPDLLKTDDSECPGTKAYNKINTGLSQKHKMNRQVVGSLNKLCESARERLFVNS